MQADELLYQGLELALVGMGTVFAFLVLLIGATTIMSRMALRLAPPAVEDAAARTAPPDAHLAAAIGAAVHRHRARRGARKAS